MDPTTRRSRPRWALTPLCLLLLSPDMAFGLQPISEFVDGAEATHPELLEADAVHAQRKAERESATWHLLPSFTAAGSYTRNQYQIDVTFPGSAGPAPVIAQDQFDASLKLSVPIVNVAAWETKAAANAQ